MDGDDLCIFHTLLSANGGVIYLQNRSGEEVMWPVHIFQRTTFALKKFKRQFTPIGDDTNEALIEVMGAKVGDELAEH